MYMLPADICLTVRFEKIDRRLQNAHICAKAHMFQTGEHKERFFDLYRLKRRLFFVRFDEREQCCIKHIEIFCAY